MTSNKFGITLKTIELTLTASHSPRETTSFARLAANCRDISAAPPQKIGYADEPKPGT